MFIRKNTILISIFAAIFVAVSVLAAGSVYAASAPSLGSQSVSVHGPHTATLSVFVNPNGNPTSLEFKYWTGSVNKIKYYFGVNGSSSVLIDVGLINLLEGTNYTYQITAKNSSGTVPGSTGSFATPTSGFTSSSSSSTNTSSTNNQTGSSNGSLNGSSNGSGSQVVTAPTVLTNGPASVTSNHIVVNGTINPNNAHTDFWFEFGSTYSLGQTTTIQSVGSGNTFQLVSGTISGLAPNQTYYYRVVAQNTHGVARGNIVGFNTLADSTGSPQAGSGQVLGVATTGNTNGTGSSSVNSGQVVSPVVSVYGSNISLRHSLSNSNALVLVADDVKPRPGEQFTYTVVYKNDTSYSFNDAKLKVIVPPEAEYIGANSEPVHIEGSIVEFNLGSLTPKSQGSISVIVRIRDSVEPATKMIFTSVLTYKNSLGDEEAITSYMTVRAGQGGGTSLSASVFSAIFGSTGMLWIIALAMLSIVGRLLYKMLKIRNGSKNQKKKVENELGLNSVPSTFEPIGAEGPFKR